MLTAISTRLSTSLDVCVRMCVCVAYLFKLNFLRIYNSILEALTGKVNASVASAAAAVVVLLKC